MHDRPSTVRRLSLTLAATLWTACSAAGAPSLDETNQEAPLDSSETTGVLRVVNQMSMEALRDRVGLSADTAAAVLGHRAGADQLEGTADDDPIDSLDELRSIAADPAELTLLVDFAHQGGYLLEPIVQVQRVSNVNNPIRCGEPTSFRVFADRDGVVELNAYLSGAGTPALFRLTATTEAGTITSPLVEYPRLFIPAQSNPANRWMTVAVRHSGQAPCWRGSVLFTKQPAPDGLGACGTQPRDLFLRWAQSGHPWLRSVDYSVDEDLFSGTFRILNCKFVSCFGSTHRLVGSTTGPLGPILQVETRDDRGRLTGNRLLFFDEDGVLHRQVAGQLYFTLPDGNLLVSDGMTSEGTGPQPWYGMGESLQSVTLTGEVRWRRKIGPGKPPLPVVTTASGNLVVSYLRLDDSSVANSDRAGIVTLDLATGRDIVDDLVDRSLFCDPSDARPTCLESKERILARFDEWWATESRLYGTPAQSGPPGTVCNDFQACTTARLQRWFVDEGNDALEAAVDTVGSSVSYRNVTLFFGSTGIRKIGGKVYRKLGPGRLLFSPALAGWSGRPGDTPWYDTDEALYVLTEQGSGGKTVGGHPLLAPPVSGDLSTGAMLPDGDMYWTAASSRPDRGLVRIVKDAQTSAESAPPVRQLEGLCFARARPAVATR